MRQSAAILGIIPVLLFASPAAADTESTPKAGQPSKAVIEPVPVKPPEEPAPAAGSPAKAPAATATGTKEHVSGAPTSATPKSFIRFAHAWIVARRKQGATGNSPAALK